MLSSTVLAAPAQAMFNGLSLGDDFSAKTQIFLIMTALSLLPALIMVVTSFARFLIILSLLRQALGLQQGLPNRVITGIALLLTLLVMRPVGMEVWQSSIEPFDQGRITFKQAVMEAEKPLSRFMLAQTNKATLAMIAKQTGESQVSNPMEHSFMVKMSAFMLSELKTAFQIGCVLFIPFLVIDLVVASVLMSMGMMMLSPLVISLPVKLLLFVLIDGWTLTINTLTTSIQTY
ncbi:flagellar type III secretion system pore protein FliP [Chromobacterium haemolyticum]|uniref:flagellar type III secretion system pore protein FliP n=1 Tax=Chromobacterium haemolyticum TaxID=394935 RepID=UPI0020CAED82|nr:flagellar type III secretion system pore protein FliP [Chromobacterium haemolyticum]